ncbi:hypothetical protein [Undibacterium luofuense]|uniref:Uncharacterized protein n=1 Tax=Undibacterium luofuense TaxID=2828733 RepID=A0A941DJH4_9BURK|nr:hypothetical protein [Undibacterium luofuense]MBR7780995.1 hypothetical protein [Undibacterium luofuense]
MMLTKEFIFFIDVDGVSGVNEVIQIRCLLFFRNFRLIMQNSASAICGSPDFLPTTDRVLCRNPQNGQKTDKNRLKNDRWRGWYGGLADAVHRSRKDGGNGGPVLARRETEVNV